MGIDSKDEVNPLLSYLTKIILQYSSRIHLQCASEASVREEKPAILETILISPVRETENSPALQCWDTHRE
jgi:hypothetical protein